MNKKRESWFKRDIALLHRLEEEDKKLTLYFTEKNGKILYDNKLTIYDKKVYYQWVQKEIKRLQDKINNARSNGYRLRHYQPNCIEEKLGRLMHIKEHVRKDAS